MKTKSKSLFMFASVAVIFLIIIIGILSISKSSDSSGKTLDELLKKMDCDVTESTPEMASVSLDDTSLYDELPEIDKYPMIVTGYGDINLEIFSSPEKAGDDTNGWLVDIAKDFNNEHYTTSDGKTISISVRDVSSGLAADYIISSKYVPELYTPSNELWGIYATSQKADLKTIKDSLIGNTAGILIKKGSNYKTFDDIYNAVVAGEITLGYTNPQVSSAGMNALLTILQNYGEDGFASFQKNVPYVAYNTVQMQESVSSGTLNAMVSEYQTYINDKELKSAYDFIPYGIRHDNPLYACNYESMDSATKEAIDIFTDYATNNTAQSLATKYGFNQNTDYTSDYEVSGSDVKHALEVYKKDKDSGKDVIAVFVADCSGSMDGDAILQLKESLTNGMSYINDSCYVGLVSYSSNVNIEVPIAQFNLTQKAYFQNAINNMSANGGTATYEAVCVGMNMIKEAKETHPDAKCMLFVLSDGYANGDYNIRDIQGMVKSEEVPIYTIAYTNAADKDELSALSNINEATCINADSDDVIYKIKSLFNANL